MMFIATKNTVELLIHLILPALYLPASCFWICACGNAYYLLGGPHRMGATFQRVKDTAEARWLIELTNIMDRYERETKRFCDTDQKRHGTVLTINDRRLV